MPRTVHRHARLALLTAFLLAGILEAAAGGRSAALFDAIDLDRRELAPVNAAWKAEDQSGAEQALLTHFQNRTTPDFSPPPVRSNREEADQNARNVFTLRNETRDFGREVDWFWEAEDKEWQYALNRMDWLSNFAGVYLETGDERYVQVWMEHIDGWIAATDEPGFPRTIDSGRRLRNWAVSYLVIVQHANSPTVTPEFNARMLASMVEQAENMARGENWRRYSNWGTVETSGLATFTILFPEFRQSDAWLHEVWFRMRVQLSEMFHPDGMHVEVSPLYHNHELLGWVEFLNLAEANGVASPLRAQIPMRSDRDLMRRPAYALMHLYKPNGILPQVGDTDDITNLRFLAGLSSLLDDPSYRYVARAGREGTPPDARSVAFHDSGYYVMRSGWGEERPFGKEHYMLFTSLSNIPWHAHYDILSIIADAYGHELLKDPGRFTYNDDSPDRAHIKSTAAHNTIVIDGQDQPRSYEPPEADWVSMKAFDYVSGRNDGHEDVTHSRSVFFAQKEYWIVVDRLTGATRNHRYDQYWHLAERALDRVEIDAANRIIRSPNLLIASPFPDGSFMLEENWISRYYRQRSASPSIRISTSSAGSVMLPTVLYPYDTNEGELRVDLMDEIRDDETTALRIVMENHTDHYIERLRGGDIIETGSIRTDARVAFVRSDERGAVVAAHLIGGSFLEIDGNQVLYVVGEDVSVSASHGRLDVDAGVLLSLRSTLPSDGGFTINGETVATSADNGITRYRHRLLSDIEGK